MYIFSGHLGSSAPKYLNFPIDHLLQASSTHQTHISRTNQSIPYAPPEPFGFLSCEHSPPTCWSKVMNMRCHRYRNYQAIRFPGGNEWQSYNNEPRNVLPVRTAKLSALSMILCWCSIGSKMRCSITPASIWYLFNRTTLSVKPF
jgi:hypothetical protein